MELCSIYLCVGCAHIVCIHFLFSVVFYCVNISQFIYLVYCKLTFEYFPVGVITSDAALSTWSSEDICKHTVQLLGLPYFVLFLCLPHKYFQVQSTCKTGIRAKPQKRQKSILQRTAGPKFKHCLLLINSFTMIPPYHILFRDNSPLEGNSLFKV